MKTQADLTFDEAKQLASFHLATIAEFMEHMNNIFGNKVPLDWVYDIRTMELTVSKTKNPCFSSEDIIYLFKLAEGLIDYCPNISPQLSQFWKVYSKAFVLMDNNLDLPRHELRKKVIDLHSKISNAEMLAEQIVLSGKNCESKFVFLVAMLLTHVIRCESIEFPIWKQLNGIIEQWAE